MTAKSKKVRNKESPVPGLGPSPRRGDLGSALLHQENQQNTTERHRNWTQPFERPEAPIDKDEKALARDPQDPDMEQGFMSHNVFEDLGFSPAEAAALKLKTDLHTVIVKRAAPHSQQELQTLLNTTQPRNSELLRGKMPKFSLEMLAIFAEKLGLHTEISAKVPRKQARTRGAAAGSLHFVH